MVFHEISKECFEWLSQQPNVKEESLTDWLLYQASKRDNRVYYKAFTRNEESHNGADWEWWILTNDQYGLSAYRLLIQAKKLKQGKDNYSAITYGNNNGMQIDLLISAAINRQALPLYAYYISSHPDIKEQLNNFSFIDKNVILWCENCKNGVYLSSALSIRKRVVEQPKRKITEKELINNSLGLSLLDLLFKEKQGTDDCSFTFLDILNRHFSNLHRGNVPIKNKNDSEYAYAYEYETHGFKYSYKQFPIYLKTIIEKQGRNIDWLESEFHRDLEGLSGIAVIYADIK